VHSSKTEGGEKGGCISNVIITHTMLCIELDNCMTLIVHQLSKLFLISLLSQLSQKTPLRVLHRRSLLDRKRYVYRLETAAVNEHFFVMKLVTSAGVMVMLML
jgi:hypothetical protein